MADALGTVTDSFTFSDTSFGNIYANISDGVVFAESSVPLFGVPSDTIVFQEDLFGYVRGDGRISSKYISDQRYFDPVPLVPEERHQVIESPL